MNTNTNKFFEKLAKVKEAKENLSATKVELGLIDELEYSVSDLREFNQSQIALLSQVETKTSAMLEGLNSLVNEAQAMGIDDYSFASGRADMEKISSISEQLGVPTSEVYPSYDEYLSLIDEIESNSNKLMEAFSKMENISLF
jgi:formyltetrahydrofolate synthetase